jgi:GNAT superfamily N-acetyltransferase
VCIAPDKWSEAGRGDGTAVCVPKIANVCVAPNLRRCGVGASLVRHCCAQAADWGAPFVVLQVDHDNKGARRFYRKLGFEEIAIQQNMWRYDLSGKKLKSVLAPKILMRLDLRSDFCMKGRVKQ